LPPVPNTHDKLVDCLARAGLGEEITLHFAAAHEAQHDALCFALHAFDHDRHAQRLAKRHNGLDDDAAVRGAFQRSDEAAIDL
jgi:hypothetical protein